MRLRRVLQSAAAHAALLMFAIAAAARPVHAQAEPPSGPLSSAAFDSVRAALASSDWNERHRALVRLNAAHPDALPAGATEPVLRLLAQEAAAEPMVAGDEDFGEYIVDLVVTGVRTRDARAVPAIVSLDGLGMSSGVAAFVASQGVSVLPMLDAFARTRDDRASDVLETYALMYARYGSRLQRADSVQVLRRLIDAASDSSIVVRSQLALIAPMGPIAELAAPIAALAVSDSGQWDGVYVVRSDASRSVAVLARARDALPLSELVSRLVLLTEAACSRVGGFPGGSCNEVAVPLLNAARLIGERQIVGARAQLDVYRRGVRRFVADGVWPRLTGATLDGTAAAVLARL